MKQFNKFLALALVAGVFSSNLLAMDASAASSSEPFVFVALPEVEKRVIPKRHTQKAARYARVSEEVKKRRHEFTADDSRRARFAQSVADRKRAREERKEERLGIAELRAEVDAIEALVADMKDFAVSLRTAFSRDPEDGTMSIPSVEMFDELTAPYFAYAADVDRFANALEANKVELALEITKLSSDKEAPGEDSTVTLAPTDTVTSAPTATLTSAPEFLALSTKPEIVANAQRIAMNLISDPRLLTAMRVLGCGALCAGVALFGIQFGPVIMPLATAKKMVVTAAVLGGSWPLFPKRF